MRVRGWWLGAAVVLQAGAGWASTALFDPARDAAADIKAAEAQAAAQHKNVLLDVGGNWCPWCVLLDRTLAEDAGLRELVERNYVVVRVNFSKENKNETVLGALPKAKGYPAWYVLSPSGSLLKAEDTSELEATHKLNAGYNGAALRTFLEANRP